MAQSTRTGEKEYQYNRKVPLPSLPKKGVKQVVKNVPQSSVSLVMTDSVYTFLLDSVAVHTLNNYGVYNHQDVHYIYTPTQRISTFLGGYCYEDETQSIFYRIFLD